MYYRTREMIPNQVQFTCLPIEFENIGGKKWIYIM